MHHRDINQYHLNVNTFSGSDHLPGFLLASSPNGTCVLSSMSLIKAGCIIYFNEFFCDGSFVKDAASIALKEEINFSEVGIHGQGGGEGWGAPLGKNIFLVDSRSKKIGWGEALRDGGAAAPPKIFRPHPATPEVKMVKNGHSLG